MLDRMLVKFRGAGTLVQTGVTTLAVMVALLGVCWAGTNNNTGFFGRQVGGVSISTDGVLNAATPKELDEYRAAIMAEAKKVPDALVKPVSMRMISLKEIEKALANTQADLAYEMPDEIRFLAGIQRIQYVFVDAENQDIILAGPGEGWKVDAKGNYVGVTTGRPVVRLDDLMVAMRTVENARNGGITCSIDPTAEGRQQLDAYLANQRQFTPAALDGIAKSLGKQMISVTGVPDNTRFARTLVASDFKMKRIAMKLEESPVKGLPSFLDMVKSKGAKVDNMMPRWWLACSYEPMGKSEDGMSWELRGNGVKVMTEDEIVNKDGTVKGSGKANPVAQQWADLMTEKYDELCLKETAFGDLRNVMDLCVISALITKENLLAKAGLEIPTVQGTNKGSRVKINQNFQAAKQVDSQTSFIKRGKEYIITASGGVDINSWAIADRTEVVPELKSVREKAGARPEAALFW